MSDLPVSKRRVLEKFLFHLGFEKKDQQKSHVLFRHEDGRFTTLPRYRGKKLAYPLLKLILKEIDADPDKYNEFVSGKE